MSKFPSLPLFTDAFISDTTHLTAQETGAYLMLLMVAWRFPDCRLPDDDALLARSARVSPRVWAKIKPTVMSFWTLEDNFWHQKRLVKERLWCTERASLSRTNGKRSATLRKNHKSLKLLDPARDLGSFQGGVQGTQTPPQTVNQTDPGTTPEGQQPNPNPREEANHREVSPNGNCGRAATRLTLVHPPKDEGEDAA